MFERVRFGGSAGQASVELIAALPLLAVALLCAWQVVLAGHAVWTVAEASRLAAREFSVQRRLIGHDAARDRASAAARRALPPSMRVSSALSVTRAGSVELRSRVPLAAPLAAVLGHGPRVTSRVAFQR